MDSAISNIKKYVEVGSTIVVGLSGGPDSMVLVNLLLGVKDELDLNIVCAHINHKLREESDDEEKMVNDFCKKNNIICENMTIDSYNDSNIENQAREKRYEFFDKVVNECKEKYLFTAHHGDDLMETMLMRIVRGSSMRGYAGFGVVSERNRYKILRPLISVTKKDIEGYAKDNGICYVVDKSNFDETYTRNRFRKNLLPLLKNENENVHEKFLKFSEMIMDYDAFVSDYVSRTKDDVISDNKIVISEFMKLSSFIKKRIIFDLLDTIYGDDIICISDSNVSSIISLISSNRDCSSISLPLGYEGIKSYGMFKISLPVEYFDYYIELNDSVVLPNGKSIVKVDSIDSNSNYVCKLNSSDLKFPLYVRNRKDGDRLYVKGLSGSKKVKDIFIDEKVPISLRNNWPIVVDSAGNIVWIPGLKKSKFDKQFDENYDIIFKYL